MSHELQTRIVEVTDDHLESIELLLNRNLPNPELARARFDMLTNPFEWKNNTWFVAEQDSSATGIIGVANLIDSLLAKPYALLVDKEHRGNSVGHDLVKRAVDFAKESGFGAVMT